MNMPDEARLKQCFESLREHDRQTAPDFVHTVSAGKAVAARRLRLRNWVVATAMLLLMAAVVSRSHRRTAPVVVDAGPLLSWSSPTAFLLEPPVRDAARRKESK